MTLHAQRILVVVVKPPPIKKNMLASRLSQKDLLYAIFFTDADTEEDPRHAEVMADENFDENQLNEKRQMELQIERLKEKLQQEPITQQNLELENSKLRFGLKRFCNSKQYMNCYVGMSLPMEIKTTNEEKIEYKARKQARRILERDGTTEPERERAHKNPPKNADTDEGLMEHLKTRTIEEHDLANGLAAANASASWDDIANNAKSGVGELGGVKSSVLLHSYRLGHWLTLSKSRSQEREALGGVVRRRSRP
ncbi:predicted protein [Nematostella vectensis]|uniref:Uncharacterized protein n=1 Tax=Nematostella vectensis TaxID=45351 RepID=A7RNU0_NEMVE|nr:predicted protein [Nematostella vectensis]|eukprot:XP_001639048.1 predicted protein [Nematostella vectensis]